MSRFISIAFAAVLCNGDCRAQWQDAAEQDPTPRYTWARAVSGSWMNPQLWGEAGFPSSADDSVLIGVAGSYRVELIESFDIADLSISNPDARLTLMERGRLEIGTALHHEGLIEINPDGSSLTASVSFTDDGEIWGSGHIELGAAVDRNDARIYAQGHTLFIAPGITIAGAGEIWGNLMSSAHIIAHSNNGTPLLIAGDVLQSPMGILEGLDSPLEFTGAVQGGVVRMQPESTLVMYELADLSQTQLEMGPEVTVRISGNREYPPYFYERDIDRVEIVYGCNVSFDRSFDIDGDLVLSALTQFNSNGSRLSFNGGDLMVGGEGTIRMLPPGRSSSTNSIGTDDATSLTFGPGITIEGKGDLYTNDESSRIVLQGLVRTLDEQDTIQITGNTIGGTFLANHGTISLGFDENVISGARFESSDGGRVEVSSRAELVDTEMLNGTPLHFGVSAVATMSGTFTTNGPIVMQMVNGGIIFDNPALIGSGEFHFTRRSPNNINSMRGTLTLPPTFSIRGSGRLEMQLDSFSSVTADDPKFAMQMRGTNTGGLYESRDDGVMEIRGDFINAELLASDGGLTELQVADLRNCWVHHLPGGLVYLGDSAQVEIRNSLIQIDLNQINQSNVAIFGSTRLDGHHTLQDQSQFRLLTSDFTGQGTIRLIDDPQFGWRPEISVTYVNSGFGPGYDIMGSGLIRGPVNGPFIVEGEMIADDPKAPLRLTGEIGPVSSMRATEGYFLLEDGAELLSTVLESSGNGFFISDDEGSIRLQDIENRSTLILAGDAAADIEGNLLNNGQLVIGSGEERFGALITLTSPTTITGNGMIELRPGSTEIATLISESGVSLGTQQRLTGTGILVGEFMVHGMINPDQTGGGIIANDLTMTPTASLEIRIDDNTEPTTPWLSMPEDGRVVLTGTLRADFDGGYTPELGDRWVIVAGPLLEDHFDRIEITGVDLDGRAVIAIENGSGLELVYTCPGDRNGDTSRDFFDVTDFLMSYQSGDPNADLNNDGLFDFLDVSAFITMYTSDCTPG